MTKEASYLSTDNELLVQHRDELDHALLMLKKPEDICVHNLKARDFRQGMKVFHFR